MESTFLCDVWEDVKCFLNNERDEPFYNERELQVSLALFLEQTQHYKKIYLEYYVPVKDNNKTKLSEGYVWNSKIKMELVVVVGDNSYIPIELKYKIKKINEPRVMRFGESIEHVDIIKTHGAEDIGCYDFWKDVRRIELVQDHYSKVVGGIALFLTNDSLYYSPKKENLYYNFRLSEDNNGSKMYWKDDSETKNTHPNFELDHTYLPKWLGENETKLPMELKCFYCLIGE